MQASDFSDEEQFSASIEELFDRISKSPNTDYLCTLLRATRDIQNKTPSRVHKAVDMGNGTVQVKAHEIPRSFWSMLIIITIDVLRKHMLPWFGNVDILNHFLDPRNALVFSSDPNVCKVLVKRDGKTEEFKLSSLITDFGSEPKKSFLKILRCVMFWPRNRRAGRVWSARSGGFLIQKTAPHGPKNRRAGHVWSAMVLLHKTFRAGRVWSPRMACLVTGMFG